MFSRSFTIVSVLALALFLSFFDVSSSQAQRFRANVGPSGGGGFVPLPQPRWQVEQFES